MKLLLAILMAVMVAGCTKVYCTNGGNHTWGKWQMHQAESAWTDSTYQYRECTVCGIRMIYERDAMSIGDDKK